MVGKIKRKVIKITMNRPVRPSATPTLPSLPVQLLVRLLAPVLLLLLFDQLFLLPQTAGARISVAMALFLLLLTKFPVLVWICLDLLRYTEAHYVRFGSAAIKTGLFGCLVLTILAVSVNAIESVQSIVFITASNPENKPARIPEYQFSFLPQSGDYRIEGVIDFGISRDFRAYLERHPGGRRVILDSKGGSIYEGRGLLAVFLQHRFDTHVAAECSSACALAFIGGQRRTLAPGARVGFHQYAMDYSHLNQVLPFYDPQKEQRYDSQLMLQRGIDPGFVSRVFDKPSREMWYPAPAALLDSGVIHRCIGCGL